MKFGFPNLTKYCQLSIKFNQTLINWTADLISVNLLDLAFSRNLGIEMNKLFKVGAF